MAYTDNTAVKTYLGISSSGDDTLLTAIITRAQAMIDAFCLRTFEASANTTRYFDAVRDVHGRRLLLDRDLCSINSVTNGDSTTVTTAQYTTHPRNETPYHAIDLLASSGIAWQYTDDSEGAIAISGKWAYSTTAPNDVIHAAIRLSAYLYRQKDNARDTGGDVVVDDTVVRAVTIPADVRAILLPYRRAVI